MSWPDYKMRSRRCPFEAIREVIEQEFNRPLSDQFASFDPVPLAAASLGQVHRASIVARSTPEVDIIGGNGHGGKT